MIFIPRNLIEQKFKNFDPPFCSLNLFISNFFYLARTKKHDLYRHAKFGYDPKKSNETAAKSANPVIYFETDYNSKKKQKIEIALVDESKECDCFLL